jgi:hypothetical protein
MTSNLVSLEQKAPEADVRGRELRPPIELLFPGLAANVSDLTAKGVNFFLASNETLRCHLNESPYGQKLTWLDFTDTGDKSWGTGEFLDVFNIINGIAFGDRGIPMPRWVMVDLILMPSAAIIASLPQDCFADMIETSTYLFESDVKTLLRGVLARAKEDGYTGPMPVGGYCAAPSAAPGTWVGWSLWSLMPDVGLGRVVKALALSAYHTEKLDGVTQYDNNALRIHTKFGVLRILVASVPFHTSPGSFVYESDFTSSMVAGVPAAELKPTFLLDPSDFDRQRVMQKAIESRQSQFYVLPPGHVTENGDTYVPVAEVQA